MAIITLIEALQEWFLINVGVFYFFYLGFSLDFLEEADLVLGVESATEVALF